MNFDYHSSFNSSYTNGDYETANSVLLKELSSVIVNKREDFVFLLNESGVPADVGMSDAELINLFIESVGDNNHLALGAALLVNMNNKTIGFDGDDVINNDDVRNAYYVLGENFSNAGGLIGSIADAVKGISGTVGKGLDARNQKQNGAMIALQKKQDAKSQMQSQAAKERQAQIQAQSKKSADKAKTTKIIVIAGVSVFVVGMAILGIYLYKRKK